MHAPRPLKPEAKAAMRRWRWNSKVKPLSSPVWHLRAVIAARRHTLRDPIPNASQRCWIVFARDDTTGQPSHYLPTLHVAMRVRFIRTEDTYPLRLAVLRPGGVEEDCHWANDRLEGGFHLAAQIGEHRIAIGSFYPEKHPQVQGWKQYRLRGMATHPDFQGQGAGTLLLQFALEHLQAQNADRVWCNARAAAVNLYSRAGFMIEGDVFDMPGIGPHYLMHRALAPGPH